jgi:hypothetical protein
MRQITFACQPSFEKYARASRREQFLQTMDGLPGEICTNGNETNWYGRSLKWRKGRSTGRNRS